MDEDDIVFDRTSFMASRGSEGGGGRKSRDEEDVHFCMTINYLKTACICAAFFALVITTSILTLKLQRMSYSLCKYLWP